MNTTRLLEAKVENEPNPPGCQLGRELGQCPLKGKCGSLIDVLTYMHPPAHAIAWAKASDDPQVRKWGERMDQLLVPVRTAQYNRQTGGR
jgi:hypothetical protein